MRKKTMSFLLLVLLLSVSSAPFSSAGEAPNPVLDAVGKKLRAGAQYYICPVYPTHGGLQLESLDDKPCPLDIVQEDKVPGLPVEFTPIEYKKGVVRVSTALKIEFPTACTDKCPESKWWDVDLCPSTGKYFLSTGGKGNKNWFKIEEYGPGEYKLVYCPKFYSHGKVACKYVGIIAQNGKRRLGLSQVPMKFVLKKA